jgi:pyruvate kinase
LIADGSVELRVSSRDATDVVCEVVRGGPIGDRKGVNLPGVQVSSPALTKKDMTDLRSGLEAGIDLVALSFVRRRDDILRLRLFLEEQDASVPVIAKIEKPEAWDNIDQIIEEADGVMVARGDLGVEMALERVPGIQKAIIERARYRGRFVITATQMLESMVENAVPTRAEVSDVANAIYDGTDAVMLSAETSTGKHPAEAARWMARIAEEAEQSSRNPEFEQLPHGPDPTPSEIVADAAYRAASLAQPAAIVALTASGSTARLVARYRPQVPVFAFTLSGRTVGQLSVIYGVRAVPVPKLASTDDLLVEIDGLLQTQGRLKRGDRVIFLAGLPIEKMGPANVMMLHRVGEMK